MVIKMENVTQFKTEIVKRGESSYILIPKNIMKFEGLSDDDIVEIKIRLLEKKTQNIREE